MPNLSGNNFRQARKCQTFREMTFARRGNAKPFGKQLSPSAEMQNLSGNDFRHARKCSLPFSSLRSVTVGSGRDFLEGDTRRGQAQGLLEPADPAPVGTAVAVHEDVASVEEQVVHVVAVQST